MKYYSIVLQKYATFTGRARRSEYWFFTLFNFIFYIVAILLDNVLGIAMQGGGLGPITIIYGLAVIIPGLAVAVRRLHDVGKSGVFLLISLIPLVGSIWLLVLFFTEGDPGPNKYGDNPTVTPLRNPPPYIQNNNAPQTGSPAGYQGGYTGGHNNPDTTAYNNTNTGGYTTPGSTTGGHLKPNTGNQNRPDDNAEYQSGDLYR